MLLGDERGIKITDEHTANLNAVNLEYRNEIRERMSTEMALQESRDKYRNLFQGSNDIIIIYDLNNNILEVNNKAVDLFGYTKDEFASLKFHQLIVSEMNEKFKYTYGKIVKKGFAVFEIDLFQKNGKHINAELSSSLIEISGEKVVQAIYKPDKKISFQG